jgi:hypothetical protein
MEKRFLKKENLRIKIKFGKKDIIRKNIKFIEKKITRMFCNDISIWEIKEKKIN